MRVADFQVKIAQINILYEIVPFSYSDIIYVFVLDTNVRHARENVLLLLFA